MKIGAGQAMKRLLSIALVMILPLCVSAKKDVIDSMNSEAFWQNIAFKDYKAEKTINRNLAIPVADTIFMVASNRATGFGQIRFMSQERGDDHLNYFLVFIKNGQWNVWRTSFKTAMSVMNRNNRDWVVYTEGFGKIFTTGLYRALSMTQQYGVNVLYLDYPSFNTSKRMMGNYYFALDNAKQSGEDFAPVFDTLKHYRAAGKMGSGKLTFFFHSMGNNMLRKMVQQDKIASINDEKWVDNLVLNAACVPQKGHAKWVDQIRFADRIYINYNPKDATLSGAHFMSLKTQLGQAQDNDRSLQAVYVNFNALCNRNHSNFLSLVLRKPATPAALAYYHILFHGNCVMLDDGKCFRSNMSRKMDYTILDAMPQADRVTSASTNNVVETKETGKQRTKTEATGSKPSGGSSVSPVLH